MIKSLSQAEVRGAVETVVSLLVEGKFEELQQVTSANRLTAVEMRIAVMEYGRVLVEPPTSAFERLDVVPVKLHVPPRVSVAVPLWTQEEGESDLSVELTVTRSEAGLVIAVDDIHVR